jgi:hypothetical protein
MRRAAAAGEAGSDFSVPSGDNPGSNIALLSIRALPQSATVEKAQMSDVFVAWIVHAKCMGCA